MRKLFSVLIFVTPLHVAGEAWLGPSVPDIDHRGGILRWVLSYEQPLNVFVPNSAVSTCTNLGFIPTVAFDYQSRPVWVALDYEDRASITINYKPQGDFELYYGFPHGLDGAVNLASQSSESVRAAKQVSYLWPNIDKFAEHASNRVTCKLKLKTTRKVEYQCSGGSHIAYDAKTGVIETSVHLSNSIASPSQKSIQLNKGGVMVERQHNAIQRYTHPEIERDKRVKQLQDEDLNLTISTRRLLRKADFKNGTSGFVETEITTCLRAEKWDHHAHGVGGLAALSGASGGSSTTESVEVECPSVVEQQRQRSVVVSMRTPSDFLGWYFYRYGDHDDDQLYSIRCD